MACPRRCECIKLCKECWLDSPCLSSCSHILPGLVVKVVLSCAFCPGCSGSVGFNPAIESVAMRVLPCFTCRGIDACIPVHVIC